MADDVASLGFEVDSKALELTDGQLRALEASAKRVGVSTDEMVRRFRAAQDAARGFAKDTDAATTATEDNTAAQTKNAAASDKVTATGLSQRSMWRALTREIALLSPELANATRGLGTASIGLGKLGIALTATATVAALAVKSITDFAKTETQLRQWDNAVTLLGSEQTTQSLKTAERALTRTGVTTKDAADQAINALLQFRNLAPNVFQPALEAAQKLSQTGLLSIVDAAKAVGEALDNPRQATQLLAKAQIQLTVAQQDQINRLLDQKKFWEAQAVVLEAVLNKTKDLSNNSDTLSAKWNQVVHAFETSRFGDAIGNQIKLFLDDIIAVINALSSLITTVSNLPEIGRQATAGLTISPGAMAGGLPEAAQGQDQLAQSTDRATKAAQQQIPVIKQLDQTFAVFSTGTPTLTEQQQTDMIIGLNKRAAAIRQTLEDATKPLSAEDFDSFRQGVERSNRALQEQADSVGKSAAEQARLKVQQDAT